MADSQRTGREFMDASLEGGGALAAGGAPARGQDARTEAPAQTLESSTDLTIAITVNGTSQSIAVDPRTSLLDLLRERLHLHGTRRGCDQGACGACTVLVDGRRVLSCLTLAAMCDEASVTTIEGLARGRDLHPLQAAFIEHEGVQCGCCPLGQLMSLSPASPRDIPGPQTKSASG